jgi:C1A family cysteine protease
MIPVGKGYETRSLLALALFSVLAASVYGGEGDQPGFGRGLVAPPFEMHEIRVDPPRSLAPLPERFDWREQGVVTPVRNQGSCGACYAFAAAADFESKLLIAGEGAYDFSENNMKECEFFGSSCGGGTYWRVINYITEKGTVLEACDPYTPANVSCRQGCPFIKTVLDWRVISLQSIPDPAVLKSYIYNYGPMFVAIDSGSNPAWEDTLENYDGSHTLFYEGPGSVNHAVTIVGWDDALPHAGGQGGWIVKNSWGTAWGGPCGYGTEGGYFTIAYGSAKIGYYSSFIKEWRDYQPNEKVLLHDEAGFMNSLGWAGSKTGWGMCKYVMEDPAVLKRVEFWTADATTDVDVFVYDHFSGVSLTGELRSVEDNSFSEMGYHSVPLAETLPLEAGDDIYVAVKLTNASNEFPVVFDDYAPSSYGDSYVSPNGVTWNQAVDPQYGRVADVGIRIRVELDDSPPDTVSSFTAEGHDTTVVLRWTNPEDEDFSYASIRYSTSGLPAGPEDGMPVENGAGGEFSGTFASPDSFSHGGLVNGTTYYYGIFAYDQSGNVSSAVYRSAVPVDDAPPEFDISVFQNPLITNHLDVYVFASEDLLAGTLVITVDGEEVIWESVPGDDCLYRFDHDIYESGFLSIGACGSDLLSNPGCGERDFNASLVTALGGEATSPDRRLVLMVPDGGVRDETYFLVSRGEPQGALAAYDLGPVGLALEGEAVLAIAYEQVSDPSHLAIVRLGEDDDVLESYVDRSGGRIIAYVDRLGTYGLVYGEDISSADYEPEGLRFLTNSPNPFTGSTTIAFEVSRPSRVRIDILTVDGRKVRTLWDGAASAGRHGVEWNGEDSRGDRVAGGIYFFRLSSDQGDATGKMILLR